MKILHTSDWHLGKKIEGHGRIEEHEKFIEILEKINDNENPDIILIAGDIFDSVNPPAEAEQLFFKTIKNLSKNGNRAIIIIPGNHDNPKRLSAGNPLAKELGIIIYTKPFEIIPPGKYGNFFIEKSCEGGIFININNKKLYLYSLPYPNETTLNETFENNDFTKRIGEILQTGVAYNKENIPTVIMSHIFLIGSSESGEEKSIELGGAMAVNPKDLPDVNYIALGHVHKPMAFKKKNAYYCGSPIEFRSTEAKHQKKLLLVDVEINKETIIKEIQLENYKPIKEYTVYSCEEAIEKSEELKNINQWVYLKIIDNRYLKNSEVRKIKENKNIVEIIPIINNKHTSHKSFSLDSDNIKDIFIEFCKQEESSKPQNELIELFSKLIGEEN